MSTRWLSLPLSLTLFFPGGVTGEETPFKSQIVGVGLFKNGLAFVKRQATVPGPGTYRSRPGAL